MQYALPSSHSQQQPLQYDTWALQWGGCLSNSLGGVDSSMTAGWLDGAALREMQGYVER